jgi:aspartyl-tRNA(Asn)/glutamyl-tRNA(Gln) amidotransferase subunit A
VAAMRQPVSNLRLGIPRAPFFDRLDEEVAKATEEAINVLKRLTKSVKEMHLPGTGTFSRAHFDGEILAVHAELYRRGANRYSLSQRRMIEAALKNLNETTSSTCSGKVLDYIQANWDLIRLRKTIDDAFADFDVIALPTMRILPRSINESLKREEEPSPREPEADSNCPTFNTFGIPAVSVPCGFSKSGLPIGLMIAGPRFSEGRVLALARAFEQATEWHKRRPTLTPDAKGSTHSQERMTALDITGDWCLQQAPDARWYGVGPATAETRQVIAVSVRVTRTVGLV